MAVYVLLMRLTPEGRALVAGDPERLIRVERNVAMPDIEVLGMYGVLGAYDFVGLLEAPDNESAARFSLALGVAAGVSVETLPAIALSKLEGRGYVEQLEEAGELHEPGREAGGT